MDNRFVVGAAVATLLLGVAACGSEGGTASPTSSASAPASAEPTSATTTADQTDRLSAALLTTADLGPAFEEAPWEPGDPNVPNPCGQPSVSAQFPDATRVGAMFVSGQELQLIESVSAFADDKTARAAYDFGAEGLSCERGVLGGATGQPVEIGRPANVTDRVGGDLATQWSLRTANAQGLVLAVVADEKVVTFTFLAASAAAASAAPDPLALARTGVERLVDA